MGKRIICGCVVLGIVKSDFVLAAGLITFITVFLMIFSMKYYMKLRIKDYTTFIVLGMKKKTWCGWQRRKMKHLRKNWSESMMEI